MNYDSLRFCKDAASLCSLLEAQLAHMKQLSARGELAEMIQFGAFLLEHVVPEWALRLPREQANRLIWCYFNESALSFDVALTSVINVIKISKGWTELKAASVRSISLVFPLFFCQIQLFCNSVAIY